MEALDQWANTMMREVLTLIELPNQELLARIMDDIVERELWPKRRQKAVDLLQQYHQQGAGIILVSAAYQPAVVLFSRKVAKERIIGIGTPVMLRDNQLVLAETLTTGQEKLQRVKKVAGSKNLEIAMGDTASDIPLLEHSLHPIAVFPDRELKQYAQSKGWKILE
jgi:phosphoserine phosphatase